MIGRRGWRQGLAFTAATVVTGFFPAGQLAAQPAPGTVDFAQQVHAILAAKCLVCHSQVKRSGGLSLATYEDVLNGAAVARR
jgi:hypothetical protein